MTKKYYKLWTIEMEIWKLIPTCFKVLMWNKFSSTNLNVQVVSVTGSVGSNVFSHFSFFTTVYIQHTAVISKLCIFFCIILFYFISADFAVFIFISAITLLICSEIWRPPTCNSWLISLHLHAYFVLKFSLNLKKTMIVLWCILFQYSKWVPLQDVGEL